MTERSTSPVPVQFGAFEVCLDSGELRKNGRRLKLSGQAIQVLITLLEKPGQLVTREELQQKLWPGASFGDFDHGLNAAVNRLREVLGDSATQPKFIDTVPRRGYRFIAAVSVGPQLPSPPVPSMESKRAARAKPIHSLVVLPFANESGDPDTDYLGQGIAETIINTLSQIRTLRVVPRATAFYFKGREANPQAVASTLHVRAVLTGRVLQRGDNLIVSTELIDTATDTQLWGARYGRKLADIFDVQEEIAKEISEHLRLQLTRQEKKRIGKSPTLSREAYQLYLRGSFHSEKLSPDDFQKSLHYCRQAIELDPNYATAHARMSAAYLAMGLFGYIRPCDAFACAKAAALKAVETDGAVAEGHLALGRL